MKPAIFLIRLVLAAEVLSLAGQYPSIMAAQLPAFEPWSVSPDNPAITFRSNQDTVSAAPQFDLGASLPGDFAYAWLRFYQKFLSSSGTVKCPMHPSCSSYSMRAISTHGLFKGVLLTADRLMHEADEKRWTKQIRVGSDIKYYDPLENNDFWWNKK